MFGTQNKPSFNFADYEMRRFGKKNYGFYLVRRWDSCPAGQRYHCSYPEAQRRFKHWLIVQRMMS